MYKVKMDGECVAVFSTEKKALEMAEKYKKRHKMSVVKLGGAPLPRASSPIHAKLSNSKANIYKPYTSLN